MTNQEIITAFEGIVSDSLDETLAYQILNMADANIRSMRFWRMLITEDSSKTRSSGETYTSMKAFPSDFHRAKRMDIGTQMPSLKQVMFEQRHRMKDAAGFYYMDHKNSQYGITNGTWAGTIYLFYQYKPGTLVKENAGAGDILSPIFPEDYHMIYPFKMAEIFSSGIDADTTSLQLTPQQDKVYRETLAAMENWDNDLAGEDTYYPDESINPFDQIIDLGRLG